MDITYKPISQLIDCEYNPKNLTPKQYEEIKSSLVRFGWVLPGIVNTHPDRENIIVDAHQRKNIVKAEHEKHGTEIDRVKYEDGEILIPCVERALTPAEERELIIRLKKNTAEWDWDKLEEFFEADDLMGWGFEDDELFDEGIFEDLKPEDAQYTKKIEAPTYEPKDEKPDIEELFDDSREQQLINKISKSDLPKEKKRFLKKAARRFCVFNYDKIADFYAHSDKETQELMEDMALVIVDFEKAIRSGFVQLSDEIGNQYLREHSDE